MVFPNHTINLSFPSSMVKICCYPIIHDIKTLAFPLRFRRAKATVFDFFLFFPSPSQGLKERIHPHCSEASTPSPKSGWEGTSLLFTPSWFVPPPCPFIFCFPSTSSQHLWSHFMNYHVPPEPPIKAKAGLKNMLLKHMPKIKLYALWLKVCKLDVHIAFF